MLSLLLMLSSAIGADPNLQITVKGRRNHEIYMEDTKVICDNECTFDTSTENIFIAANEHHRTWLLKEKVSAIYNKNTVNFTYPDCDFKKETLQCINQNQMWLLRSTVTLDSERATLSLSLLDSNGVLIGQATHVQHKRTKILEKKTIMTQKDPRGLKPTVEVVQIDPMVMEVPPMILDKDIHQTMMMLYVSVRKQN